MFCFNQPLKIKFFRGFLLSIFLFVLCAASCARPQRDNRSYFPENYFYRALLLGTEPQNTAQATAYFEKALFSSNVFIRQAAAEELANLMMAGTDLTAKTIDNIRLQAVGTWGQAFDVIERSNEEDIFSFLLSFRHNITFPNEARLYVLQNSRNQGIIFSETELAAINGHFASVRARHNEALIFFRMFQQDGRWPEQLPDIFLRYPALISDLGRTFQHTASGNEGINLFLQWENNLPDDITYTNARYNLLFFAARIARQRGSREQAILLFDRARMFAPVGAQLDACIWYLLDLSVNGPANLFIQRLEQLLPYLQRHNSIDNILERFYQRSISNREWRQIINVFELIKDYTMAMRAGYAWLIARLIEEGWLSADELQLAARVINLPEATPAAFFRLAYDAGSSYARTALYYRFQSAVALGLPFLVLPEAAARNRNDNPSPVFQFLNGFFYNDAASHSLRFIWRLENELSPEEMRIIAQNLSDAGMYPQSMRLVSLHLSREGFVRTMRDMELLWPIHYRELVERYAAQFGFPPALLFSLIRQESAFQSAVVSRAGAVGLTQLMPATAREMADRIRRAGGPDFTGDNLNKNDPALNIHIGAFYLNRLMTLFDNDLHLALLSYNGGMGRVRRWRAENTMPVDLFSEGIPIHEMRDYRRILIAGAAIYEHLYYRPR